MNGVDLHELLELRSENKTLKSVNQTLNSQNKALRYVLSQHEQQSKPIQTHDFGEPLPNILIKQAGVLSLKEKHDRCTKLNKLLKQLD